MTSPLNAIKRLAGIPDHLDLISPVVIQSIGSLRKEVLGLASISLNLEEMLIALSISSTTSPIAHDAAAAAAAARLRGPP